MNIKERIQTVLQKLKLLDKAKANQLNSTTTRSEERRG